MPLNENEQRILAEIERQFHANDPESARRIGSTTLRGYYARNSRWAALGLIIGLLILVVAFASSWIVGVFGFLIMVGSAVVLIQNLHKMSRIGLQEMTKSLGAKGVSQSYEDFTKRFKKRFGKD